MLPLFHAASSNPALSPFLYTTASTSPLVLSRHVWSPSGDFCFVTGDDGCLCILRPGKDRCDEDKVGVHGPAAPLEEDEIEAMDVDVDGSASRRVEVARRVREMRKGEKRSGVVRDVCVMDKPTGGLMVVTVGFDWTIRVLEA